MNYPPGRYVMVIDRGWIFAGDATATTDGYVRLSRAVSVFRWEQMGFARMLEEWQSEKVELRKMVDVEIPPDAVIFRIPVENAWGIK